MIIYGDPQFRAPVNQLAKRLCADARRPDEHHLDHARALLIRAGQLEQAMEDALGAGVSGQAVELVRQSTDCAARFFAQVWFSQQTTHPGLLSFANLLPLFEITSSVTVKVPEGFEFYTLFPEQYCETALLWAQDRAGIRDQQVLVVGIRSIGTALSSVVSATLATRGWKTARLSVRPTGTPFSRTVDFHGPSLPNPWSFMKAPTWPSGWG